MLDEATRGGALRALRSHNYRLYLAGQFVSNTGTFVQQVAQIWLVLNLTHGSGRALALVATLQTLPMLVFGLWGGVIVDRYAKRHTLLVTQTLFGLLALVLGLLAATGSVQLWQVYVIAVAGGMVMVVNNPAQQTFGAELVGTPDLANALALSNASFNVARLLGPALGGLVISAVGVGPAFLINAASFGAVLLGLALMRSHELHSTAGSARQTSGQLRAGLAYLRQRRDVLIVLLLVAFVAGLGMNLPVTNPLMSRQVFHRDAASLGLASSMLAVGALLGAVLAARRAKPDRRLLLGAAVLFGALEISAGLMPVYPLYLAVLVPTGLAMMTFNNSANAIIQLEIAPEMRGRVMSLYFLTFMGSTVAGVQVIGWLADALGPRWGMLAAGSIALIAALAFALATRRRVR